MPRRTEPSASPYATAAPALTRLAAELALREDDVPGGLDAPLAGTPVYQIGAGAFLLSLPMGLVFHYRRGVGTTFRRWPGVGDDVVELFFEGPVLGAIAWLNDLVPLHVSAVAHEGRVHAFAGEVGAGASTLAAALAARGMALCADEVLLLDPATLAVLPALDRPKLWGDALDLAGCVAGPAERLGIDKFVVADLPRAPRAPLPLHRITFLEGAAAHALAITPVGTADRLERLVSAWYRPCFFYPLAEPDRAFDLASRLARVVPMARLDFPRDPAAFDATVALIMAHIHADD